MAMPPVQKKHCDRETPEAFRHPPGKLFGPPDDRKGKERVDVPPVSAIILTESATDQKINSAIFVENPIDHAVKNRGPSHRQLDLNLLKAVTEQVHQGAGKARPPHQLSTPVTHPVQVHCLFLSRKPLWKKTQGFDTLPRQPRSGPCTQRS